jgi:hypothetical protein
VSVVCYDILLYRSGYVVTGWAKGGMIATPIADAITHPEISKWIGRTIRSIKRGIRQRERDGDRPEAR